MLAGYYRPIGCMVLSTAATGQSTNVLNNAIFEVCTDGRRKKNNGSGTA